MPEYHGELMACHWLPSSKKWIIKYHTPRQTFDEQDTVYLSDVSLRAYLYNTRNPAVVVEGKLTELAYDLTAWLPVTINKGIERPEYVLGMDQVIDCVEDRFEYARLTKNQTIEVLGPLRRTIVKGHQGYIHKAANRWLCKWYKQGTLVKEQEVTTIDQWGAIRYLMRLRSVRHTKGTIEKDILTYDDNRGNVVIVKPVEEKSVDKIF